ncbi:APC family permease [Amylibacter sp. SFDW26]|uniref:APC family permease n=1 Tax=Amylibacter sp. SFDW26 TaxID=2652722 RepID=UPI001D031037|nr:amino acid permease [Amylibacter sp. SFDW26]
MENAALHQVELKRAIGLPRLVLYGLGVTIGAGIYVLVGETAARAGIYAPIAFLLAAFVMAFSACSFAELSSRIPKSAGEAAYVDAAFGWTWLTLVTGLSIVLSGSVAASAISLGSAGYVAQLIDLPIPLLAVIIVILMGGLACWGIQESVTFASVLTVIEILGLLIIIVAGFHKEPSLLSTLPASIPTLTDGPALSAILSASLIAFFAFVGFDDVVNIVEETINPARIMPIAIGITLIVVTILYVLITLVALNVLPLSELSASKAPVGLLFERLTGISPLGITLIAIFATLNGVIIQLIMASRVLYGLSRRGQLPKMFSKLNKVTKTPILATLILSLFVIFLVAFVPLDQLAEWTSQINLSVFCLINIALVWMKLRKTPTEDGLFTVPILIPVLGALTCLGLLIGPLIL